MERLLTSQEIETVKHVYRTDPIFRYHFGRKMYKESFPITEILSVSRKELLMIKGNSDTGYDHIRERHNFFTTKIYTKPKENGEKGFQNQSRFPHNVTPIDFIKIADELYQPKNEVKDNQNEGAKYFDLYVANVIFPGFENPEPIRLLLYKDTRIIHTIYPVRDTFSRKIKYVNNFPYRRDEVDIEYLRNDTLLRVRIPYVDVDNKLWYAIFIDKDFIENREKWRVIVFLGHHISKYSIDYHEQPVVKFNLYRATYQYADLRIPEKFIKDFDEKFKAGLVEIPEDDK